jgi:tRNA1Val (adenine37-N6)-methyltransferase
MSNTWFRFKEFKINQENCAMKVGTDGVLLGTWADLSFADKILDIGTGTALIALILAQRNSKALIDAIEIDKQAFVQAKENIKQSPWKNRIDIYNVDLNFWNPSYKYDCIISNPPFFEEQYLSKNKQRDIARHTETLQIDDLLHKTNLLLTKEGVAYFIFPYDKTEEFITIARKYNLHCRKKTYVYPKLQSLNPKRTLLAFSFEKTTTKETILTLEKERHCYTEEYKELVKDFYLFV